ncbi:DEAD/DEAH box helicase [uncultured Sphaerotilus sp.]|uniref:DEAD/DEAH box helicase n=1 Tax=uncultured Sphaerotilus sp. TaxID=474984 RepID=UPI0030CA5251
MASTSSPRKTPSARKRAAPRPTTASDLVEAPVTATPDTVPDHTPDTVAAPAAAPARKRAPRKTPVRAAAQPVEAEAAPVVAAAPVEVPAAPAPAPAEPAVTAPAKKAARRTPARKKAAAPVTEPVAVAEPVSAPEPLPEPEPVPAPTPAAEPAPVPEAEPIPAVEAPAAPPPDLRPPHSSVTLLPGVRQQLHWVAGRGCPPELDAAAQALGMPTDAAPLVNDLALVDLVRLARERRHTLQVDEAVWDWLAQARDMRSRVAHLEAGHPAGPLSPALAALVTGTLRPYQAEGALYAACAGRSLLADDAGLGKTVQAIAALRLIGQSFGAARALVLCPPERLAHWHAQWQQWTGTAAVTLDTLSAATAPSTDTDAPITAVIADLDSLAGDLDRLQALDADVVVIDEPADATASLWAHPDSVARLQSLAGSPWALVLARTPLDDRPDAWQAMLDWIDGSRFGAVAALQGGHFDALAPWMLRRSRTFVLRQLPETVEQTTRVTLPPDLRATHDTLLGQVRRSVQRWQRSQFLGSSEQRQLLRTLHALRQCGQDGKIDAALQAIDMALGTPETKVVVFSQWPAALDALGTALEARGTTFRRLHPELVGDARRALIGEFQQAPELRVLLCNDDDRGGQLGLRHAATAIVHLDRPWNPALLMQRLSRVHRTDRVRLVAVHHVLVDDSIESRLVDAQQTDAGRECFVGLVDGPNADVFLEGPRLTRFLRALAALVDPTALNPG